MSWVSGVEISRKIPGAWEDFRGMGDIGYIGCHGCHECYGCHECHVRKFHGKFFGLEGLDWIVRI